MYKTANLFLCEITKVNKEKILDRNGTEYINYKYDNDSIKYFIGVKVQEDKYMDILTNREYYKVSNPMIDGGKYAITIANPLIPKEYYIDESQFVSLLEIINKIFLDEDNPKKLIKK